MKYFVDAKERAASGDENYIEFRLPTATEEFWDKTSLYMSETTMDKTGFGEFWLKCMCEDIVFDMDTISKEDLHLMKSESAGCNEAILEIINELEGWIDANLKHTDKYIGIVHSFECENYYRK